MDHRYAAASPQTAGTSPTGRTEIPAPSTASSLLSNSIDRSAQHNSDLSELSARLDSFVGRVCGMGEDPAPCSKPEAAIKPNCMTSHLAEIEEQRERIISVIRVSLARLGA